MLEAKIADSLHSIVPAAHAAGRTFTQGISREEQRSAGQFMTPPVIARFMARRLLADFDAPCARILEPSAGAGVLAAAAVEALLDRARPPKRIELLLYEQDARLLPALEAVCAKMRQASAVAGVVFESIIRSEDFLLSELALRGEPVDGLVTIANPPFLKLNKSTDQRATAHGYAVHGQPNLYGLFMAATARLTPANGRWCFIVPRSWMGGQYFKAVRGTLLTRLSLNAMHSFESRRESFEEDSVLQETMIVWASGYAVENPAPDVLISASDGIDDIDASNTRYVPVDQVVAANDERALMFPASNFDVFDQWKATLSTYGMKVSTGPVVAFRSQDFIRAQREVGAAPLLWMQHVGQQQIRWPVSRKPAFIRVDSDSRWMLLPNAPMVVMRRFSPKEDLRRVTCAPYVGQLPGATIGLENHLNYIHRPGGRMSQIEVRGLSAFLASKLVDVYLRRLAGSTQINATDLRRLPLPPMSVIEQIGRWTSEVPSLDEIDQITARALRADRPLRVAA